jgi:hypothetical protein
MKKLILLVTILLFFLGCETGVNNQGKTNKVLSPEIVDTSNNKTNIRTKPLANSSVKIFSNRKQPGYYLQMAVFSKGRPSKQFLEPLETSKFNYIILNKFSKNYVLIGPYISYYMAKSKVASVKRSLGKHTFVVQVLRP